MISFEQLPEQDLVFESDGTLRLLNPGEETCSVVGPAPTRIELPNRGLLASSRSQGKLNVNASLLTGQPIFGAVILTAP